MPNQEHLDSRRSLQVDRRKRSVAIAMERRRQPQTTIKTLQAVFAEIDWEIKEIASLQFRSPKGDWTNDSYGFIFKVPPDLPIQKLWLGWLNHRDIKPPGIWAGMDPMLGVPKMLTPKETGYSLCPEEFHAFILLKPILSRKEIDRLEDQYGKKELKDKIKKIILKTYPFSLK